MIEKPEARRLMDDAQAASALGLPRDVLRATMSVPPPPAPVVLGAGEPTIVDVLVLNRANPTTAWTSGERSEPIVDSLTSDMWAPGLTNAYHQSYGR